MGCLDFFLASAVHTAPSGTPPKVKTPLGKRVVIKAMIFRAHAISERRTGPWTQFTEVSSRLGKADLLVYTLILCLGASQFFLSARENDFPGEGVFWADSGRSLIEHRFYGINGYAETNMPPGLPALLGVMGAVWGYYPAVFLHAMAVFGTLAFLASYELLRRQAPRIVAAAICMLLMTSVTHFRLVTQVVWPSYPYAFTTIGALLVAGKLEQSNALTPRITWGVLLTMLLVLSLMFASAGIALLGAIAVRVLVIFLRNRSLALARLRIYLPIFLVGIAVQGFWMHRPHPPASAGIAATEWPLPGFPQPYLSQLKVKNGNYPELGVATPLDVAVRILRNARVESDLLSRMLMRRLPQLTWTSIFVAVPLLLIALGWYDSIRRTGGGLQEWYFAGYEFIYLLWPWNWEPRFFLPIAPLACLYLWFGGKALLLMTKNHPRAVGVVWLPMAIALTIGAGLSMHDLPMGNRFRYLEFQNEFSFLIWLFSAVLAVWMIWANTAWLEPASRVSQFFRTSSGTPRIDPRRILQGLGIALVIGLVFLGLEMQVDVARANLDSNSGINHSADAEASTWIRSHTDQDAVVMARHVPITYHYSKRKIIWFPPSSDPHLLMKGIVQHKVNCVIVVRRESPSYLPPEDVCFDALLAAYPGFFSLMYEASEFRIFGVNMNALSRSQDVFGVAR